MRYHLLPAIIKKTDNNCWQGCGERGTLSLLCEYKLIQPLWKTESGVLKKLQIKLPYDQAISLLVICPKEMNRGYQRNVCASIFITASFTIAQAKCPSVSEQIKKMWTYRYYSDVREKESCHLQQHVWTLSPLC